MKQARNLITFPAILLLAAGIAMAQNNSQPSQNAKPAAQDQQQQQPAAGQQSAAGQAAAVPPGKRQPQAKTKEEYAAYVALMQMTDPAAMEKASDDFVAKYPDSELKGAVYQRTMAVYQQSGNEDKTVEMGRKSLSYNPDDPGVLVAVGELIASRTRETDLDKDQRLAEATKDAKHALETVTDYPAPPTMPADQVEKIKNDMRGTAYSVLGMAAYTNKNYPEAVTNFKQSVDVTQADPDPTVYLRYTLALDKAARYAEALEVANKTLALPDLAPQVQQLATQEKGRLEKLASAPKPAAAPAPSAPQPQAVQPH
jgi:tetratricopeptide (TPR) repeat protein